MRELYKYGITYICIVNDTIIYVASVSYVYWSKRILCSMFAASIASSRTVI